MEHKLSASEQLIADDLSEHALNQAIAAVQRVMATAPNPGIAGHVGASVPTMMFLHAHCVSFALAGVDDAATYEWMGLVSQQMVELTHTYREKMANDPEFRKSISEARQRISARFPGTFGTA